MGKTQLHALLAVEQDRRNRASEVLQEATVLFEKKTEHLDGVTKIYKPLRESSEAIPPEVKEVVTTVADKLSYVKGFVSKAIDVQLSKEETNASGTARANLIFEGVDLGSFSATSLLALGTHLQKILGLYREIPTLDPVKRWDRDPALVNVYVSETDVKYRTNKVEEIVVPVPATKEHPAQIAKLTKDVQMGVWETTYRSGRITPAQKSVLLSRIDALIAEVKQARARANTAEVVPVHVGDTILNLINQDIL